MKEHEARRWRAVERWKRQKRLLALWREVDRLNESIREAGLEPLEEPYQRGWERWFEWRQEARRRKDFPVMEGVLELIQKREWSRFPDFRQRNRRTGRSRPQEHLPVEVTVKKLQTKCGNPALVKYFETVRFRPVEGWKHLCVLRTNEWGGMLRFMHPELLESRVEPYWITHRRVHLPAVESRLDEINSCIERNGGWERIWYLKGWRKWRSSGSAEKRRRLDRLAWWEPDEMEQERMEGKERGEARAFSFSGGLVACKRRIVHDAGVTLEISTPALLFPAISLLFLSFTNRFLHLAALIRQLHRDWLERGEELLRAQIDNLRRRLALIRAMQLFGAFSLFLCVVSMVAVVANLQGVAIPAFTVALLLMGGSLACLCWEVWISGGALKILLNAVGEKR